MKLTYRDIMSAQTAMMKVWGLQVPLKVSIKLARNNRKIEQSMRDYNEVYKAIIARYPVETKTGEKYDPTKLSAEEFEKYNTDVEELLDVSVDIDIHEVTVEELEEMNSKKPDIVIEPWVTARAWFLFQGVE